MPDYIFDPLETDVDQLQQDAFDYIQVRWPDWKPEEGNLETWLIGACARIVAEARDLASDVPPAIFRYFGKTVLGLPPVDATPAQVDSTWTFVSNPDGRTIEAGWLVGIPDADGEITAFEVASEVTVASGDLTAEVVTLIAVDEGADTSGLGGTGVTVDALDERDWINTITLTGITTGGIDAETDDQYLDRLSARLTLLAPRPILPRDFELFAKDTAAQLGVTVRVLALDGYNPANQTFNNERMIAIAAVDDASGANISGGVKTAIDNDLQEQREVNFIINMMDPTRTTVDVTFVGKALPGADPDEVESAGISAIQDFLNPNNWGQPASGEERRWTNQPVVRQQDLSTVLNMIEGFDYWTTLTIGLNGGAQTSADHNLAGDAPLPTVGAINGTVTA